jgi:hypothetical protein
LWQLPELRTLKLSRIDDAHGLPDNIPPNAKLSTMMTVPACPTQSATWAI